MALISPVLPTIGEPNSNADQDIINALTTIIAAINGGLDSANISTAPGLTASNLVEAVRAAAGLNDPASALRRRGKSIIATEESRTDTAYGLMTTPDRVQNIVMPTDGLIFVAYQAMWKESVDAAARAAFFIGPNQLKEPTTAIAPAVQETSHANGTPGTYKPLGSSSVGLSGSATGSAYTGHVTTGQVAGSANDQGICAIFAAAGTYDVSVQFKASSGSVTAKERRLWCWSAGLD